MTLSFLSFLIVTIAGVGFWKVATTKRFQRLKGWLILEGAFLLFFSLPGLVITIIGVLIELLKDMPLR